MQTLVTQASTRQSQVQVKHSHSHYQCLVVVVYDWHSSIVGNAAHDADGADLNQVLPLLVMPRVLMGILLVERRLVNWKKVWMHVMAMMTKEEVQKMKAWLQWKKIVPVVSAQ